MSPKYHLLVVDDELLVSQSLQMILPPHWKIIYSPSIHSINWTFPYDAALVDLHLEMNAPNEALGLKVIKKLKSQHPLLEVIAMSGDMSIELMEKGLQSGAQRFLSKPLGHEELLSVLTKIEALIQIRWAANNQSFEGPRWVGSSDESNRTRKELASLKGEEGPILIFGESGSGKEVAAKLIHHQEGRGPLLSVNVASITETLFESEFFGHIKGSFTGADRNKIGLVEAAAGGELFLDEIEALAPSLQAKLLRFLETGEYKKVGGKDIQIARCRILCASNRDLIQMVKDGLFREDLYWRISGKQIKLAPLRKRIVDIKELAQHFLASARPYRNKTFSIEAIRVLESYNWPGNVRELKRVCEQLSLVSPLPVIRAHDVKVILVGTESLEMVPESFINLSLGLNQITHAFESQVIRRALENCKEDVDATASVLQISRSSLYKKIKDYQIEIK